jgi:hypothetical protein
MDQLKHRRIGYELSSYTASQPEITFMKQTGEPADPLSTGVCQN